MWWLYVPMQFDDYAVCLIIQESPTATGPSTTARGSGRTAGSSSSAGRWSTSTTPPAPARRPARPSGARTPEGKPLVLEVESQLAVPLHVGGGYGGDPDWIHGTWKGENFSERVTYDMDDAAVQGRFMFGCIDHVGRARPPTGAEGWGLFEHFVIGRHDPSGFTDFFTLAP